MNQPQPGTVRCLTGPGRSAIATLQIAGDLKQLDLPPPLFRAANGKPIHQQAINALAFGVWGDPGEEVVLCRAGERTLEVTCHGGVAAVSRVLGDAVARGFVEINPTPATLPLALMQARTQRTAELILEQASGVWEPYLAKLETLPREEALRSIDATLAWASFGRHLVEPWNVVLCGRPNVGKSSLMNALAGFTRSIVSAQAGTTRDHVTLETAIDGWPMRITDTAGVRETDDTIEQAGVQQTLAAIRDADLVVIVLDASEPLQPEDHQLLEVEARCRLIVAHKSDLPRADQAAIPAGSIEVSSTNGQGIGSLLHAVTAALIPVLPPPGQPLPVTSEQKQVLLMTRKRKW